MMHTKSRINTDVKRIIKGTGAGLLSFLLESFIFAFVLTKNDLSLHTIKCVLFIVIAVSAMLAGFISKRKSHVKGIICGAISSIFLLLVEFSLLIGFNRFQLSQEALLLIPSGVLFGILGGIISSNLR